jgi:hypothetical protein
MFTISSKRLDMLRERVEDSFVESIRWFLADVNPAFLPRFPPEVQLDITRMLMRRAESVGATTQSATGVWLSLMLLVAPNLGEDPAVRAWVSSTGASRDERIGALDRLLTAQDWERIDTRRSDLPLVTPEELDDCDLVVRTASALRWVLWDAGPRTDFERAAREAVAAAARFDLAASADAPLALAVARELYARDGSGGSLGWRQDVQNQQFRPRVRVEMLKARVMLDHGRWT